MIENNKDIETINRKKFLFMFSIIFGIMFFLKDYSFTEYIFFYITATHEMCHGIMAIITGGNIKEINLSSNGGNILTSGGIFPLVSIAGYIGTTIIGAILILLSKNVNYLKPFLILFIGTMLYMYIIYMSSYFNTFFISMLVITLILGYLVYKDLKLNYVGLIFGSFFIIDSFSDAKVYLFAKIFYGNNDIIYQTDAGILARYFGLEFLTLPIALSIFSINMFIIYILYKGIKKQ